MSSNGSQTKNGSANGQGSSVPNEKSPATRSTYIAPKAKPVPKAKKDGALASFKKLRLASKRPLPTQSGDGTYLTVVKRPGLKEDIRRLSMKDFKTLLEIVSHKVKGETQVDDKTMIMERTIQIVAGLSDHSKVQEALTNSFIDQLWNSLDHPPMLFMGDAYRFRQPDGSNNNPYYPRMGAAKTPYSRSCKPKNLQLGAQPDPEAVYEAVMARGEFKENPNKVSSILWYWATIIIHDLFWTNSTDPNQNDSSSYLDLAPLYGCSKEACDSVRTFKGGMLKADCFADRRLIGNPPGVCIILIMFNRFHNHIAANLADINEGGRFTKPSKDLPEEAAAVAWAKYDEELFQTARLVTCGLYINITLIDYVRNIINLNRCDTTWTLDPRQEMGVSMGTKEGSEAGTGNIVSAEFNLCYRWHSCISDADDKWIQDFYKELLGDNYGPMNFQVMMMAIKKFEMSVAKDPGERVFGGMKRGPDGKFNDDELVEALATAIEQPGGAFGARNVPRVMKPVEMLGIIRGRKWNLAGLNEFRKHFGLKAYETFEDINSDPEVADSLRHLYQHPDNVELYPGIVAEEAKTPMAPGVGIAPTYTISRVVLSDAVALVRGDRYYTTDYNPRYLTNWGFKEVSYDLDVNHGCVFYKLFLRAFPNHFKDNSVYAHYPMVIPSENHTILTDLKRVERFSFDRPVFAAPPVTITSFGGAKHILTKQDKYRVSWQDGLGHLMGEGGRAFVLSGEADFQAQQQKCLSVLLSKENWKTSVRSFYSMIGQRLLAEKSYKLGTKTYVDIVRDVGNMAHTHFVSRVFNLPLKTNQNPKGVYSEQELYMALAVVYLSVFCSVDPVELFPLRQQAKQVATQLGKVIEMNVKLATTLGMSGFFTKQDKSDPLASYGVSLAKCLKKEGLSTDDIVWSQILPTAGAMVPNQGQAFAQSVDWYLSPAGEQYRAELHRIALLESGAETDALLLGYAMEGVRMAGGLGLHREAVSSDVIAEDDGCKVNIQAGDKVFVSFTSAAKNAAHFPSPDVVDPKRPLDSYIHSGLSAHTDLSREVSHIALTELFRTVFRKKGLKRAAGPQGEMKKVNGNTSVYMNEEWSSLWPFPTAMKVTWDE
ncbi:heme peroxidase [Ilyonectria robusta]|uniref:heme peroxidase n=1 Tax=Ilyonectria robusta TaxID=1079257 RepID=UPI001E8E3B95|nr:heme peroxidase [Ilyonectria robusta]KAH8683552.1 heme peroxidase [Ilyonectria robusta]